MQRRIRYSPYKSLWEEKERTLPKFKNTILGVILSEMIITFMVCFSQLGLLQQNALDWGWRTIWRLEAKGPGASLGGFGWRSTSWFADATLPCTLTWQTARTGRKLSPVSSYKGTNLHLLTTPLWGFRFQCLAFGRKSNIQSTVIKVDFKIEMRYYWPQEDNRYTWALPR